MRWFRYAALAAATLWVQSAQAATEIDFFFPVPVQGQLANEMQRVVEAFNTEHPDVHVTASYTGSYDDTSVKTRAAMAGGRSPAVVLMSANYIRDYAITGEASVLDGLIQHDNQTPDQFMVLASAAGQRGGGRAGDGRAVPELHSRALLQRGRLPGGRARPGQAAGDLGAMGGRSQAAHQARRHPGHPLGPDDERGRG